MGIKQQRAGSGWELQVEAMLGVIRPHMWWVRNYPRMQYVSGKGWVVTGTAVPDLTLVWQGVPMLIDLKSTNNKTRYSPYKDQKHQFTAMTRADRSGALAGYLLEWRMYDLVEFFRVQNGMAHSAFTMYMGFGTCGIRTWEENYMQTLLELMLANFKDNGPVL